MLNVTRILDRLHFDKEPTPFGILVSAVNGLPDILAELAAEVGAVIRALAAEGRSMLVAAHDLNLVRDVAKQVVFMVGGEIIEEGSTRLCRAI